ncbi:MAG TPA: murein biosynthesis integral membrane protein MurJ [Phototrophicaceae bacterium]|nr:murein biosynthesis integral membrane protein MurJ [Phototrophicaceae bacterium]
MAALSNKQIARAAVIVVGGFVASGVLGFINTAVVSSTFGASNALDAFYAAQRIPEALFTLVAGGALGSSFIPVFARFMTNGDDDGAWQLASAVLSSVFVITSILAILTAICAPIIVPKFLDPGSSAAQQALTISLTQIMLVTVAIFGVSGLLMGILNARQNFTLPALALSMDNLGQIFGALVLTRLIHPYGLHYAMLAPNFAHLLAGGIPADFERPIYGLAFGAVLGASLHLAVQLPGLRQIGAKLRFNPNVRIEGVSEVLLLMGPRVLGLAVVQINFIVNVNLTSGMVSGSLSALVIAWSLLFFVLGVIAQSVGTAVFPSLSALAAAKDMAGFKDRLAAALRSVLFLSFPAMIGMIVLGAPAIALLYQRGVWSPEDTAATAWALSFFAIGIAGHSLLEVLSRAFYALSDTRTPVLVGIASMISNVILSLIFIHVIGDPTSLSRGPFAGLALSMSLTTLLEALTLWLLLRRRIGDLHDRVIVNAASRALIAALGMGACVWGVVHVTEGYSPIITAIVGLIVGLVAFFGLAFALGIEEARTVPRTILRRVK